MAEQGRSSNVAAVVREMGLTEANIERRKRFVALEPDDLARIASVRDVVAERADALTAAFFSHLSRFEEANGLLSNRELLERARQMKRQHLVAMVTGPYDSGYVEQRVGLGLIYSQARLDNALFLGAFHTLLRQVGATIMKHGDRDAAFESFMAVKKVAFFDVGLIVDVLATERQRVIRQQQEAIRELSTPVLQIRERLLLLPIIGVIDTHRARLLTESLLRAIRSARAKVVVMDVTGVATIDSKVANHLLQTIASARLMGATVIVSGLSSDVAQSLVALGIDLGRLNTVGDLQGGMEEAERQLGYRVTHGADSLAGSQPS